MSDLKKEVKKRPSMRKAINDKCKDCVYDPLSSGTWRKQIQECNSPDCPLYELRPFSAYKSDETENNG